MAEPMAMEVVMMLAAEMLGVEKLLNRMMMARRVRWGGEMSSERETAIFFSYIFLGFFVYTKYLCRPSEASTRYCAILGSNPPKEYQSLPCAGEKLDLNPGLLICSQVRYH